MTAANLRAEGSKMLASLRVENFRCIREATLDLDAIGTGIVGPNGSGKTSLLESIYFLAHGRSFRTSVRDRLLGPAGPQLRVIGHIVGWHEKPIVAGAELAEGRTRARLAGENVASISHIARYLPVQIIDPSVHRLVEEGSARRRRLLDWGVFHVEHDFLEVWRRYQRALIQRNASLRNSLPGSLPQAWDDELDGAAQRIDQMRHRYAERLVPRFAHFASTLLNRPADLRYARGWGADLSLRSALGAVYERDQRVKSTSVGPHRADLHLRVEGQPARDRVSRGQQKLLAAALVLAQIELAAEMMKSRICLLLDDPAAELDVDSLGKLLQAVAALPVQLVATSLHEVGLDGMRIGRMFHVEHGCFTPVL